MAVEGTRQLADEVVACIETLAYFCDALEGREGANDSERWIEAASNVATKAREYLETLRSEVDDWEFTVGLCTGDLDGFDVDDDDLEDLLAALA
jgi:hypothetical protein